MNKDKLIGIIFVLFLILFGAMGVIIERLQNRIEVLEETLPRADQSCADLEERYNYDVKQYWNPLVKKFNDQTSDNVRILNQHADMLNDMESRLEEVEKRRFF